MPTRCSWGVVKNGRIPTFRSWNVEQDDKTRENIRENNCVAIYLPLAFSFLLGARAYRELWVARARVTYSSQLRPPSKSCSLSRSLAFAFLSTDFGVKETLLADYPNTGSSTTFLFAEILRRFLGEPGIELSSHAFGTNWHNAWRKLIRRVGSRKRRKRTNYSGKRFSVRKILLRILYWIISQA